MMTVVKELSSVCELQQIKVLEVKGSSKKRRRSSFPERRVLDEAIKITPRVERRDG
jgi:hypothetical protein